MPSTQNLKAKKTKTIVVIILFVAAVISVAYQITKNFGQNQEGVDWSFVWFICPNGHTFSLTADEVRTDIAETGGFAGDLFVPCSECDQSAQQGMKCKSCGEVFIGFECPECGWSRQEELRQEHAYQPSDNAAH